MFGALFVGTLYHASISESINDGTTKASKSLAVDIWGKREVTRRKTIKRYFDKEIMTNLLQLIIYRTALRLTCRASL